MLTVDAPEVAHLSRRKHDVTHAVFMEVNMNLDFNDPAQNDDVCRISMT